jgi:CRP-like cAMP-binding protein
MRAKADSDLVERLRQVYIFSEVSPKHLEKIAAQGKLVRHAPGHVIMSQGRVALGFHLILSGEAEVLVNDELRRVVGPGDYVGEIAVIDGKPRTATVRAKTDIEAWALSEATFLTMLEHEAGLAVAVLRGLCGRIREAESIPAQA